MNSLFIECFENSRFRFLGVNDTMTISIRCSKRTDIHFQGWTRLFTISIRFAKTNEIDFQGCARLFIMLPCLGALFIQRQCRPALLPPENTRVRRAMFVTSPGFRSGRDYSLLLFDVQKIQDSSFRSGRDYSLLLFGFEQLWDSTLRGGRNYSKKN